MLKLFLLLYVIGMQGVQYWEKMSFDDFGDCEINFLNQIEKEFRN
jgi:hypothetical protein